MKYIAPSILSADFSRLGEQIKEVELAGADWIHVDVMDGHFVPNITMGPLVVSAVKKITRLPIDVHLMIEHPERYIEDFAKAGASLISVHAETCVHLNRTIAMIRENNCRPGAVLNPSTPISSLEWVLEDLDFVLVMSVNPGFGGQKFIPSTLQKIRELKKWIESRNLPTLIEIDGGVNQATIQEIARSGVDVFVAGSAIFESRDYPRVISEFKRMISGPTL